MQKQTLHALAGKGWGCQKELLLRTYKIYIEPSVNYAAAVWSPNASSSSLESIQKVQNAALRIATGCYSNTTVEDLHLEAKVPLVADHLEMLGAQYLASSLRPSHPSHAIVTAPNGNRDMKKTLYQKHITTVEPFLSNGVLDPLNYKAAISGIHTSAISASIAKLQVPNVVLGSVPLAISPSEVSLPRIQRTTLAQLRSGHCKMLNDYRVLLKHTELALCPECLFRRHSVRHIFNCDAAPTILTTKDLWTNPVDVTVFLRTLPSFAPIFPPDPAHPRPPPEPPP